MDITKEQQYTLISEVKRLIDDNRENTSVLERARALAVVTFGILSNLDGDEQSVGFNLQDYAYNCLQASTGDKGAEAWIDENDKVLKESISAKFSDK